MGLCKCRKVTNLFCFQCRINVCDKCIVEKHKTCVVNEYMQWLQHSEYDPTCRLCTAQLDDGQPTIRLGCLHIFHLKCLMDYAASLPPNTAPAGYACPKCSVPIVPPAHATDAVSTECRKLLESAPWARIGIRPAGAGGMGMDGGKLQGAAATQNGVVMPPASMAGHERVTSRKNQANHVAVAVPSSPGVGSVSDAAGGLLTSAAGLLGGAGGGAAAVPDPDDDKYARRSVNERFTRVVSNQIEASQKKRRGTITYDNQTAGLRRTAIIMLLIMLIAVTTIELLTRAKPSGGHHDALLSPDGNPHIRTG